MFLPIKATVAGGAALAVGGTGIWYAFSGRMPDWKSLDQDSGFSGGSSGYSGKYADSYARFLTGMGTAAAAGTDTSTTQTNANDDWWKWSFNTNYYPDKDKGGFTNNGQDLADAAALKAKCDEAYKSDVAKIKSGNDDLSSNEFKEDKLWKFCSFNGVKPKTVQDVAEEVSKYTSKVGSNDTHKPHLLSVESKDNSGIWTRLNSLAQEETSKTGFFFNESKGKNIRERCKHVYEKVDSVDTNETENKPSQTNLYKWCSAKGTASS